MIWNHQLSFMDFIDKIKNFKLNLYLHKRTRLLDI